jgi:hypothetical protein
MQRTIITSTHGILILLLLNSSTFLAQTITVHAGSNQIINWEKTRSAQLKGNVSSKKTQVEWTCPQDSEVVFKNASSPATEATFPRPGYYLLFLSRKGTGKDSVSNSNVVNVFKANSYKDRLSDLIRLMTVDEKIAQLTNETDSIPRLGIPKYNYWS